MRVPAPLLLSALAVALPLSPAAARQAPLPGSAEAGVPAPEASDSTPAQEREWLGGRRWASWARLTGDWGGLRGTLERSGVRVLAATDAELGGRRGGVQQLSSVALAAELPSRLVRAFLELRSIAAWGAPPDFPSQQGLSNLTAPPLAGAGEAWLETVLGGERLRIRAGRAYATSDFAAVGGAALFLNPSFGTSPVLSRMAAYPTPTASVSAFVQPGTVVPEIGAGIYRAAEGGATALAQLRHQSQAGWGWSAGTLVAIRSGAESDDSEDTETGARETGEGVTGLFLTAERAAHGGRPGAFLLLAGGRGPGGVKARHLALGTVLEGEWPWAARSAGLALSAYADGGAHPAEVVPEAFVRFQPAAWLFVQPDMQLYLPLAESGPAALRANGILRLGIRY